MSTGLRDPGRIEAGPASNELRKKMELAGWKFEVWDRGKDWIEMVGFNDLMHRCGIGRGRTKDDAIAEVGMQNDSTRAAGTRRR